MQYNLAEYNLFISHFILGCKEVDRDNTKTNTIEIEALHQWFDFKDTDWGMKKMRTERTQFVSFLNEIDLTTFHEITQHLFKIYKGKFPFSNSKDFIADTFRYTIFDLEQLMGFEMSPIREFNGFRFYTYFCNEFREYLDFAIKADKNIKHYKQYYRTILDFLKDFENEAELPQQIQKTKPELTINQIALKFAYSEIQITRENGTKIAKEYGHNSGEKLFQRFTYYSSPANRKGKPIPFTPKKLQNKIKLIESIIELLPSDKQERAKDEVKILNRMYETEYQ